MPLHTHHSVYSLNETFWQDKEIPSAVFWLHSIRQEWHVFGNCSKLEVGTSIYLYVPNPTFVFLVSMQCNVMGGNFHWLALLHFPTHRCQCVLIQDRSAIKCPVEDEVRARQRCAEEAPPSLEPRLDIEVMAHENMSRALDMTTITQPSRYIASFIYESRASSILHWKPSSPFLRSCAISLNS
jgi:hypothetical protein